MAAVYDLRTLKNMSLRKKILIIILIIVTNAIFFGAIILAFDTANILYVKISADADGRQLVGETVKQYEMTRGYIRKTVDKIHDEMRSMGFTTKEIDKSEVIFFENSKYEIESTEVKFTRNATTLLMDHLIWLKRFTRITTEKKAAIPSRSNI
jgi:hypothetical protein